MPFKSKSQMRAAFGGYLGKEMKGKADTWAHETPDLKGLPDHARKAKKKVPMLKGSAKDIVASNTNSLRQSGKSEADAVGASLRHAGKSEKAQKLAKKVASFKTGKIKAGK